VDNVQDPVQEAPQGQAEPAVEQTPGVKPAEVPAEPTQAPTGTSFEEIAAKKGFKSPDDLAKAYANLESQNTKVEMKKADLEKLFFSEQPRVTPQPETRFTPDSEAKALDELRRFVQSEAVEPLKKELQQQFKTEVARLELKSVIKERPDFVKYAGDIKELKSKYPDMPFDEAYIYAKALKGDLVQEARSEGLKQGTYASQRQGAAQVITQKPVVEGQVQPTEVLRGAGNRWSAANQRFAKPETIAKARAEQAYIENELIAKGATGLETNIRDLKR